jgi:haloalkane dehalogenase
MRVAGTELFFAQPIQFHDTGRERIAYRKFGRGEPIVFLHGWPLSSFTFRHLLPYFVSRFTCYLPDLPGAGDTEWTDATDFSIRGRAETMKNFIDRVGIDSYVLVGQDTGATIGRHLALLTGNRVRRFVMTNTEIPGHRPPWIPLYRLLMFLPGSNAVFRQLVRSDAFVRSPLGFGGCFVNQELLGGEFKEYVIHPIVESRRRMVGQNLALRGIEWSEVDRMVEAHGRLRMPVLLVWGEEDPTFPIEIARRIPHQFPNCAGIAAIPRAKLLVHEEQAELVSRTVMEFLTR